MQTLPVAERPFFTTRETLDDVQSMSSARFAHGGCSIGRYRRDRPGLGITTPNPLSPTFMAVVMLRPLPGHIGWRDGRAVDWPALQRGAFKCLDLRESWTVDLSQPFDSFNAFVPLAAFDDITSELRLPRVERLNCPVTVEHRDETMLGLANALSSVLARPQEVNRLFADHVFSAMTIHLGVTYGGLNRGALAWSGRGTGRLTPRQERRVLGRLRDDMTSDLGLSELASFCGLSRSHFVRAFKETTGMPPHRWWLLHRTKRAKELLEHTNTPISKIAADCGFADQSHLTRVFSKVYHVSPGAWRRQRSR
jgi:AraC family transcriptional regulator